MFGLWALLCSILSHDWFNKSKPANVWHKTRAKSSEIPMQRKSYYDDQLDSINPNMRRFAAANHILRYSNRIIKKQNLFDRSTRTIRTGSNMEWGMHWLSRFISLLFSHTVYIQPFFLFISLCCIPWERVRIAPCWPKCSAFWSVRIQPDLQTV